MQTEKDASTFGHYLKTARDQKGLSIEEMATAVRVGKNIIIAIENEDHANLPAEVFVKGFIRIYSDLVGGDKEWIIQNYLSSLRTFRERERRELDKLKVGPTPWLQLLLFSGVLVAIIYFSVYLLPLMQGPSEMERQAQVTDSNRDVKPHMAEKDTAQPKNPVQAASLENSAKENLKTFSLKVQVVAPTWMKIIADNLAPTNYTLKPGDHLELEASQGFNILIGDATAVNLTVNDKPVNVIGKAGQIVTMQIP